jgi:hypothetical protein
MVMKRTRLLPGLVLVLSLVYPWVAGAGSVDVNVEVKNITGRLWRIIDMTRVYDPQFQVLVVLEAPDRKRLAVTFRDESARTFVVNDVITLEPKQGAPLVVPGGQIGEFFTPALVKLGRTLWFKEWLKHQGKEINREFRQLFEQKKQGEREI